MSELVDYLKNQDYDKKSGVEVKAHLASFHGLRIIRQKATTRYRVAEKARIDRRTTNMTPRAVTSLSVIRSWST